MEKVEEKKLRKRTGKATRRSRRFYDKAFKVRTVQLHVEDGHTISSISGETGISVGLLSRWVRKYKVMGQSAFDVGRGTRRPRKEIPPAVRDTILTLKDRNPKRGLRRIVDSARYFFHLPVGIRMVRATLVENGREIAKPQPARKKNVQKPRRFERSAPNQMWQSDIMMVRMGGRQLYLVGYIDDYSRFMVGLEIFQQQTADNVLEVYLRATTEHSLPREMLTDNGRQYVNWRGMTKFQKQLKKDKIAHIRSQPQHPMTLGKIERFWQTILMEFFDRARFVSLEDARARIQKWVQYYNFKRPHQGIGGLCPADRYFEIAHELRKTIEKGIEENVQELALRGKPKKPFYLLGRMGTKDVVLRAQKGKLTFAVNDDDVAINNEQAFNFMEADDGDGTDGSSGTGARAEQSFAIEGIQRGTACRGGAEDLGGEADTGEDMQRDEDYLDYIESVGEAGDGGDVAGTGAACTPGQRPGAQPTITEPSCETSSLISGGEAATEAEESAGEALDRRMIRGDTREGAPADGSDPEGAGGASEGNRRSGGPGDSEEYVLRMGASRPGGDVDSTDGSQWRSSCETARSGERGIAEGSGGSENPAGTRGESTDPSEDAGRLRTAAEIAIAGLGRYR
jgi:transposase InsO family protein